MADWDGNQLHKLIGPGASRKLALHKPSTHLEIGIALEPLHIPLPPVVG